MSVPSQRIDAVVRDHVAPALKRHGFTKFDRSWYLDSPDVVQAINLQGSSWNDDESARFTLNLGLWFPAVSELMGRAPEKNRRPPEYRCTVRQRIGKLTPDGADLWWTLATDSASETVGPEVVDALVKFGLPWLSTLAAPAEAIRYLRNTNYEAHSPVTGFTLAMAFVSTEAAKQLYRDWAGEHPKSKIDEWAEQHGLAR